MIAKEVEMWLELDIYG